MIEDIEESVVSGDNEQIKVTILPKNRKYDYDVIRLELTNIEGENKLIDMTPDEAVEIIGYLAGAMQFYLLENDKYSKLKQKKSKDRTN